MQAKPIELKKINEKAENIYEAIIATSKRARQINDTNKLEYNQLLSTIVGTLDDEFEEKENPDQLRLSLEMEKRLKPHQIALNELLEDKLKFTYKEAE